MFQLVFVLVGIFFTDSTMVNHHFNHHLGEYVGHFFQPHQANWPGTLQNKALFMQNKGHRRLPGKFIFGNVP